MAVASQTDLLLALERGEYERVVGTDESIWVDFKEGPYQLDQPHQRWELAKDVAAFANAQGGTIVIGYRTQRPPTALVDVVQQHRPVPKNLVEWDAYRQTIDSWVYPHPTGLEARWFPPDTGTDRGVLALIIPPQPEHLRYFVVREMAGPGDDFGGAVGIPIRRGDVVTWLRFEAVHDLIREALAVRRGGGALATAIGNADRVATELQRIEARCAQIEVSAGWADSPHIAFHAVPAQPIRRPADFYAGDGLRRAIGHPAVLRELGFNIRTDTDAEVQPDGSLAAIAVRRGVWLSRDGLFSAAGVVRPNFFGWHFTEDNQRPVAVNPRVLAEFVLEFSRFFHGQIRPLHDGQWSLWLSLVGFDRDGGVVLVPALGRGGRRAIGWRGDHLEERQPLQPTTHVRLEATDSAGRDAYDLLQEFYAAFGFAADDVPFVENGTISERRLLDELRH